MALDIAKKKRIESVDINIEVSNRRERLSIDAFQRAAGKQAADC